MALRASVLDCASPLALWSKQSNGYPCRVMRYVFWRNALGLIPNFSSPQVSRNASGDLTARTLVFCVFCAFSRPFHCGSEIRFQPIPPGPAGQ